MKTTIDGEVVFVLNEQMSNYKGAYFVIKVKGNDGEKYDIVPSSDCETYSRWKEIAKRGARFKGFQYLMEKDGKKFLNKKVIPVEVNSSQLF